MPQGDVETRRFPQNLGESPSLDVTLGHFQKGGKFKKYPRVTSDSSAIINHEFVVQSILECVYNGEIEMCNEPPVNPISVSKQSSGKLRLICDMRHVNKFVDPRNSSWMTF